jgi:selenide,water dikinase
MDHVPTRLTSLAHGGGCGCKLSPAVLHELLAALPAAAIGEFPDLLVGTETADDAAVYRLTDEIALVATTDFFTPVVDDPYEFGRIAATNALSDIYAMGGTPILSLAVLGMPLGRIEPEVVQRILRGGAAVCRTARIPIAGGHSIDSAEPIYGLVALGTVHPGRVLRNSGARPGDALVLGKGLGVGIFSAALKQQRLDPADYATMIETTTRLNAVGPVLAALPGVHAMTDVTGFGLLGHALEMCRGSGLAARIALDRVPMLAGAAALAQAGIGTGAAARNWASYADAVTLPADMPEWQRGLLCDPQTSGGLLIAAAPAAVAEVLARLQAAGFAQAAEIGWLGKGEPGIEVSG